MAFHAKPFRGVFGGILLFVCLLAAALLSAASPTKRAPLAPLKAQKLASSTVLVLDLGSTSVKAGYVGSAKVAFSVPSVYVDIGNGTVLVGDEAKNSGRKTRSPIVNGVLKDFPGVLSLIEGTLKKLGVSKTKAVPNKLMLLVSTLNTESTRQAFAAHVMSRFKPAGLFLSEQAMVEPFIAGSVQNGMQSLVVEFGLTATATPIYKANNLLYSFPAAIKFTDIVAADLDKYIAKQLRVTLDQAEQLKIMPGVFFAAVPDAAAVKGKTKPVTRKLKNGTQITIPGDLRWTAVEGMFKPSVIGKSGPGFADIAAASMADTPAWFKQNAPTMPIVISGGSTLLQYLPDRMRLEIAKLAPWNANSTKPAAARSAMLATPGRAKAAYMGASALGFGSGAFGVNFVTQGVYNKNGLAAFRSTCVKTAGDACACTEAQKATCGVVDGKCLCWARSIAAAVAPVA